MGREVKRVPLGFDWPVGKTWFGYVLPSTTVEVPEGPGWQMWENMSEGSPISPVFETPEALARWLSDTGASSFGGMTESYETWLWMIVGSGSAVGVFFGPDGMQSGVAMAANAKGEMR